MSAGLFQVNISVQKKLYNFSKKLGLTNIGPIIWTIHWNVTVKKIANISLPKLKPISLIRLITPTCRRNSTVMIQYPFLYISI